LNTKSTRQRLLGSSVLVAAALAVTAPAGAAFAQNAQAAPDTSAPQEVIVTGSILRKPLSATADPVTTLSAQDLTDKGITTVTNAIQSISANGSSSLPNSFSGNGAFAGGAANVSLRGLTSNSTLVLFDGQRMTYYPLADDGTRNFVDLNTIPDIIIDRVQVDKDGASSTYGADAIAGVVNVITKKTYQGVMVNAEGGWSQHGGGDESHFSALFGKGDLGADGYNVYLGVEYEHDDALYARDRGYPYNTSDQSSTCGIAVGGGTTCRLNNVVNGLQANGSFLGVGTLPNGSQPGTNTAIVAPWSSAGVGGTQVGDYQLLNPAAGCINGDKAITITPAQAAAGGAGGITAGPTTLCSQDNQKLYGIIAPDDKRFSVSLHATKKLWGDAEGYFTANYYHNDVLAVGGLGSPSSARQISTPGANGLSFSDEGGTPANPAGLTLPVFVCPLGSATYVCNGTEAGAKLNPNNPFAAAGNVAQLFYSFGDIPTSTEYLNNTYRLAGGFRGTFNWMGPWEYAVDATGSQTDLQTISKGDIYINNLLTAVNQGTYNFANPNQNTAAIRNFVAPTSVQNDQSQLAMIQGTISKDLYKLPGGELRVGLIAAARYESVYDPSGNPDNEGTYNRYFGLNPVGVIASRTTEGVGYEFDIPVLPQIDLQTSGRFDNYSTGQSHFSPKGGVIVKPFKDWAPAFDKFTIRATYSEGFRIPSFAESNELPTTGFVNFTAPQAYLNQHPDGYGQSFPLGETTVGTSGLKPETSHNFTGGIVFEPDHHWSFSIDFFRIVKDNVIVPNNANLQNAVNDYLLGQPIPTGYKFTPGTPDPGNPNGVPLPAFVEYGFINQDKETSSGWDLGGQARYTLPWGIKWTSSFDGTYQLRLNLFTPTGVEAFAGTIGPYNNVSAAGTPKFKANWSNTFVKGPVSFTLTAYYTDGYDLEGPDFGGTAGECTTNNFINTTYADGVTPVRCKVKPFWDIQTHIAYDFNKRLQFYVDVDNLFDKAAPYDPTTYGGFNYNDVVANSGIYGRFFKFGVRAKF